MLVAAVLHFSLCGVPGEMPLHPTEGHAATSAHFVADVVIPKDTPVRLMVVSEVSTKERKAGYRFKLRVDEPVLIGGRVAIPVGATAWGEVSAADSSGIVGKSGRVTARLLFIDTGHARIPIAGEISDRGKSGTAETVMGVVLLGPLGLFARGNNAKIKAGERTTAFTTEDVTLELGSAAPAGSAT